MGLNEAKRLAPPVFTDEKWKGWTEYVEDYADACNPSMKEALKMLMKDKEEIGIKWSATMEWRKAGGKDRKYTSCERSTRAMSRAIP